MQLIRHIYIHILVGVAFAVCAEAQSRNTDQIPSLEQQVQRLTGEVDRLQRLVSQLQIAIAPSVAHQPPGAAYARVEIGMTRREVVQLVGEPSRIQPAGDFYPERWTYPSSQAGGREYWVTFAQNGRVSRTAYD
jgi:hypothetical protein